MIFVDRTRVPVPEGLAGDDSPGGRERKKAREFFAQLENAGATFEFNAYKHPSVKAALRALFHGKCAYCESPYAATQPMDVEHFRPKGGFIGDDSKLDRRAYWWLAAEWENLLPSCIDCNRRRQHLDPASGESAKYGKENLFPVSGARALDPDADLTAEEPMLLDPCLEDPAEVFVYRDDGQIQDRPALEAQAAIRARRSMEVFGLIRDGLRSQRRDQQIRILLLAQEANRAFRRWVADLGSEDARRECAEVVAEMLRLRTADQRYAGLTRFHLDSKLAPIRSFLTRQLGDRLPATPGTPDDILERFVAEFNVTVPLGDGNLDFDFLDP